jgi:hypothetical protein
VLLLTILHHTESHKVLALIQFQQPKGTDNAMIIVTDTNNYRRILPLHNRCTPIPVRNRAQEDIYQVLGILSRDLHPHVEQEQQICSVSGPKTSNAVSVFLEVEQQLYFQVFFPLSVKIIIKINEKFVVVERQCAICCLVYINNLTLLKAKNFILK